MSEYYLKPGDRIHMPPEHISAGPPADVQHWLFERGWIIYGNEWRREHAGTAYTWEQAVAIEFYKFITLGGR